MATPPKKNFPFRSFRFGKLFLLYRFKNSKNQDYSLNTKHTSSLIVAIIKKFTQLSFQHLNYTLSKRAKIEKYKLTIFHANFNGGKKIFYLSASYFGGKENEKPD